MKLEIYRPEGLPKEHIEQLYDLISEGGQVNRYYVELGIPRSLHIAIIFDGNVIASTATIKHPLKSYTQGVFKEAGVPELSKFYKLELGYIVTREGYGGMGLCKSLLAKLIPLSEMSNLFATTRKDSMSHILGKYEFKQVGSTYKKDLQLFIRNVL